MVALAVPLTMVALSYGCVILWLRLPVLGILLNMSTVTYVHLLLLFNFRGHLLSLAFYKPKEPLIERIRDP
jgi:hypothetical protein